MRYIISNASVFDGTGAAPAPATVVVKGERIAEVLPGSAWPAASEAGDRVIDGNGGTLMPGLIESHAHLTWPSSIEKIYHQFVLPPEEMKVAAWRNARVLLDSGFTSAYSAGALGETIEVELRTEIAAGRTPGPRLKASTIERSPQSAGVDTGDVQHGRGAAAMRAFIAHCRQLGIDSVKLLISGEDALLPGSSQHILYSEEELAAAAEAAHAAGLWIAAHTQAAEAIKRAVRIGVRILYHCSYADAEALDLLEANKDRLFVAPAIGVIVATLEAAPPPHIDMRSMKEMAKPVIENTRRLIPELKRRGVRVLPGGDYGFPFNPNGTNARDLQHFVELYGYTPGEALMAATKLGGELLGMGHELGLVKPGYLADLLLIDGDPTRDVRLLQERTRISMIMQGGRLHKAPQRISAAA
ncbi:MAG TPA: amidohydrolase family protein [Steroidobacteraceae bacterium]|nr:amidohydrolase family protein [Steroidobacteraceae bacterium]